MSTLGGSKGERHAKPKFQTIDINTLHRSSRGETLEPSTQKNQPPRKYGMQTLGKVPSARRPPANLPSLKAETLTPTDQQGSWGGGSQEGAQSGSGSPPITVDSSSTTASSTIISNISSTNVATPAPTVTTPSTNNNQASTPIVVNQQTNFNSTHSAASTLPSNNNNNNNNILNTSSTSSHTSNNSGSASTTWSSVTTGNLQNEQSGQPPIYQSPQFQHEFPSLDGSTVSGSKGHSTQHQQHAGSIQSGGGGQNLSHQEMSLRPQTNVGSWMQQQQQQQQNQGGGNRGDMMNGPNSQQAQALQNQVPHPVRSLMPSFMVRGGVGGVGGAGIQGSGGGFQQGYGTTHPQSNYSQTPARPRSQPGAQSQPMYDQQSNYYSGGGSGGQNTLPQRRAQGSMQKRPSPDDRQSVSFIDPEMVHAHQRPIIKEEELKRMDYIAKDTEGWANQEDIDYNQKLHFSDDETVDGLPERTTTHKHDKKHNESHAQAQARQQQQHQLQLQQQQEEEKRSGEFHLRNYSYESSGTLLTRHIKRKRECFGHLTKEY